MMNNIITQSGPNLTSDILQSLEGELGSLLPKDYKFFLLEHNGGIPQKPMFRYGADCREAWVDNFVMISADLTRPNSKADTSSLSFWMSVYGHIIPSDILHIGTVCRDDWLVMGLANEKKGQVYVVRWEDMPAERQETEDDVAKSMVYVAPTFNEFCMLLYKSE